jgi:hypothetical protein
MTLLNRLASYSDAVIARVIDGKEFTGQVDDTFAVFAVEDTADTLKDFGSPPTGRDTSGVFRRSIFVALAVDR